MPLDQPPAESQDESFRVNVPASAAPDLEGAPDSGYVLCKYTKDESGFCLDLQSLRLPDEQPEDSNPDDDLPLEDYAKKTMKEEGLGDDGRPTPKE